MKLKRVVMLIVLVLVIIGTTSYGTGIDFSPIETQDPEIEIPTIESSKPETTLPEVELPDNTKPDTGSSQSGSTTGTTQSGTSQSGETQSSSSQSGTSSESGSTGTSTGSTIEFPTLEKPEPEIEIPTLEKPEPEIDVPTKLEPTTNTTQDQSSTSHGGGYNRGEQTTDNDGEGPGATSSIDFNYQDYQPGEQQGYDKVVDWAGSFLGILRNIGVIVGVIGIAIIGIKYMLGSVEQKAQYKQTLIPFAIGILMLVAGTVLVSVIYEVFA